MGGHGPFRGLDAPLALRCTVRHRWTLGKGPPVRPAFDREIPFTAEDTEVFHQRILSRLCFPEFATAPIDPSLPRKREPSVVEVEEKERRWVPDLRSLTLACPERRPFRGDLSAAGGARRLSSSAQRFQRFAFPHPERFRKLSCRWPHP